MGEKGGLMGEPDYPDYVDKQIADVRLSAVHSQLTQWRAHPLSEAEKEKILQSWFVSRADYEQYAIHLRESEECEQKDAEAREAARQARLENDPAYWKRMYQHVVEREEERKRKHDMQLGMFMVCAVFAVILYVLKLLNLF
jgi:hypothetical protein